jgi:tripartite-type tricarboxylate transporter receptor subunit TctC
MTHVPYKGGGPLVNDAIAGHVPVAIASVALFSPHVKSGKLNALAVTSAKRATQLPDVPTVSELRVPGFNAEAWWGLLAPAKTPPEIVARMNAAMVEALNDPMVKQNLSEQGVDYRLSAPDVFGRFIENEIVRWAKVVMDNNIVLKD